MDQENLTDNGETLTRPIVRRDIGQGTPPGAHVANAADPRSSAGRVRVIEESPLPFIDEVAVLLGRRLRAVSLALAIVMFLAFVPILSFPGLWLRLAVLIIVSACHVVLRSVRALSYLQLRALECVVLGAFVVQATYMPDVLILERAYTATTVIMDCYFNLGVWAVFIVSYGLLIPNPWQRAVIVMLPLSGIPYLNFYLLGLYEPAVQKVFASLDHGVPIPLPFIAALAGIYGAHTMYTIRREAYRARQFGQYRLRDKLGGGGMGEVYRAEHELLKRPCAIKMIRPGVDVDAETLARFEREVQATARLSHWNTVEIYDYGRTDAGVFYYVMELLPGMSLAELVEQFGPVPPERAIYLLRQVCAALREAHGLGLIHRDVKPGNIIASRRGGLDDVAKLLDFGLVKISGSQADANISQEGVISGTPAYMSPEQASYGGQIDARSDIYSLGAVAYCLVTGRPPFDGPTAMDHIIAHARDPVLPPSLRNPGVPLDLEMVILRCLEKKPEERFPDAASLDDALAACECAGQWNAARAAEWWRGR